MLSCTVSFLILLFFYSQVPKSYICLFLCFWNLELLLRFRFLKDFHGVNQRNFRCHMNLQQELSRSLDESAIRDCLPLYQSVTWYVMWLSAWLQWNLIPAMYPGGPYEPSRWTIQEKVSNSANTSSPGDQTSNWYFNDSVYFRLELDSFRSYTVHFLIFCFRKLASNTDSGRAL